MALKGIKDCKEELELTFAEFAPGQGDYCESTGYGFRPGNVPKDMDAKSLIDIG